MQGVLEIGGRRTAEPLAETPGAEPRGVLRKNPTAAAAAGILGNHGNVIAGVVSV